MTSIIDTWIVYKVLRILTTKWDDMDAFRLGIIDADGKVLKRQKTLKTAKEKKAYTFLHRLVFNLKRILEKLPFGKTKISRYATALVLLREHMETEQGKQLMEQSFVHFIQKHRNESVVLTESTQVGLAKGRYRLKHNMLDGELEIVKKNSIVVVPKDAKGTLVMGVNVFEVITTDGRALAVSEADIEKV